MSDLFSGQGYCPATERILIRPTSDVILVGAGKDAIMRVLSAVHHANRHGSPEDFIAVALPTLHMGEHCALMGTDVELLGSEASLGAFLRLDGVVSILRRRMIEHTEVGEVYPEAGMTGAAYVRVRKSEKYTQGWIRRASERAKRRGKPFYAPAQSRPNDLSTLALMYDQKILHVRETIGVISDAPVFVSTYGFSLENAPAVLPVFPESARYAECGNAV